MPTFFIKFKSPCKITSEFLCRCKSKTYPKFKEKTSVMNYHNEVLSLLLRSMCVLGIDPLSEGLVTPPLGVEKLSPRFNFFDMFSCIT